MADEQAEEGGKHGVKSAHPKASPRCGNRVRHWLRKHGVVFRTATLARPRQRSGAAKPPCLCVVTDCRGRTHKFVWPCSRAQRNPVVQNRKLMP